MKPVVINPDGKRQTVKLKEAIAHMDAKNPPQNRMKAKRLWSGA